MTKQVEVLFQNAAVAAKKLKCPAKFERVSELRRIMAYGVMTLPALVIDGKVVAGGNVPGVEEIMQIIKANAVKIEYKTYINKNLQKAFCTLQVLYLTMNYVIRSDKNRKRNLQNLPKFCKVRYNEIAKNAIFAISLFLYCRFTLICNLV